MIVLNGSIVTFHELPQVGATLSKARVLRIVLLVHHYLFVYLGVYGKICFFTDATRYRANSARRDV